jgi:hypothetical protein
MNAQANTLPYPQTPVQTQNLQIPHQQTQYLQIPHQQNPNSKANPFNNPFLQSK